MLIENFEEDVKKEKPKSSMSKIFNLKFLASRNAKLARLTTQFSFCAFVLIYQPCSNVAYGLEASHHIEVNKSARQLSVVNSSGGVLQKYSIAVGRGGPGDKHKLGDQKTPTGIYEIVGFKPNSDFFYFVRLNYPNERDARKGFRAGNINQAQYSTIINAIRNKKAPPQNTPLGGAIGIHGIGEETQKKIELHNTLDWTQGCIALRNEELHDLLPFLSIGIRVVIKD